MLYDVIIVGGGPAGLTAAIYTERAKLKTLLLEKGLTGGQAVTTELIENYPGFPLGISGLELLQRMDEQARNFGAEIKTLCEVATVKLHKKQKIVIANEEEYVAKAIIITSGVQAAKLNIPGEKEFTGKGVSYCATCDGAFFKDKKVLVVGGGDAAIEEALFLTRFATGVTIVHRRDALRATKILQERALKNPRVHFIWNSHPVKISGDSRVREIILYNKLTEKETPLEVDGVFIYIGTTPNTDFVKGLINLDNQGYILTDENLQTSIPGIFAAGDVRHNKLKQVATAVGEGAFAAFSAQKYLEEHFD
ncbi:MAG: thioredoxin-disulfide reductase [Candidatus Subteraquimicrobiales bacterium]|nr:thioredoxin-disulfide reductase [Candidatus Subteraquimicrobiales bacterium]